MSPKQDCSILSCSLSLDLWPSSCWWWELSSRPAVTRLTSSAKHCSGCSTETAGQPHWNQRPAGSQGRCPEISLWVCCLGFFFIFKRTLVVFTLTLRTLYISRVAWTGFHIRKTRIFSCFDVPFSDISLFQSCDILTWAYEIWNAIERTVYIFARDLI